MAYLSVVERPCIYSGYSSSLDGDSGSFPLEGMFPHIVSLRFSNGLVKGVYLE